MLLKQIKFNAVISVHKREQVQQLFQTEVKEGAMVFVGPEKLKGKMLRDIASAKVPV